MREKVFTWLKYLSAFFLQAGAFAFSIESIVMALVLIEISYDLSTMCKDSTYDAHGRFGLFELCKFDSDRKWPRRGSHFSTGGSRKREMPATITEPWSKKHKKVTKSGGLPFNLSNSYAQPLTHQELIKYTKASLAYDG